jgi:hypothetical protein
VKDSGDTPLASELFQQVATVILAGGSGSSPGPVADTPLPPMPSAERRFVKVGGVGSGTSWEDASSNIQAMMDELALAAGGEVWVAAGKYTPGSTQTSTFTLKNHVKVYGGFPAGITSDTALNRAMHDRSARFNIFGIISDTSCETIMSGDIYNNDIYAADTGFLTANYADNVYLVVTGTMGAVLDGFTVKGGYANGAFGGGIYNNELSSLILTNVTITGNQTSINGGMYNNDASPIITNVTIKGNKSNDEGGGMFNNSYSSPILTNVAITGNYAISNGGGMYNGSASAPILTNVTITDNQSGGGGGGMYNTDSSAPILTNVTIASNKADASGGGMNNNSYSSPILTNVTIAGNQADTSGGGMSNSDSAPILTNVTIAGNIAESGGGMSNSASSPTLTNVTITGNKASVDGGGMNNSNSSPTLTNVTIAGNKASNRGGGMFNVFSSSLPSIRNSIVWGNTASAGDNVFILLDSTPAWTFSLVQGSNADISWLDSFGDNNGNNIDPGDVSPFIGWIDPAGGSWVPTADGNYKLDGPAGVNVGSSYFYDELNMPTNWETKTGLVWAEIIAKDVAGDTRKVNTIDMGAYEKQQ